MAPIDPVKPGEKCGNLSSHWIRFSLQSINKLTAICDWNEQCCPLTRREIYSTVCYSDGLSNSVYVWLRSIHRITVYIAYIDYWHYMFQSGCRLLAAQDLPDVRCLQSGHIKFYISISNGGAVTKYLLYSILYLVSWLLNIDTNSRSSQRPLVNGKYQSVIRVTQMGRQ
jgi:hypothetical protein